MVLLLAGCSITLCVNLETVFDKKGMKTLVMFLLSKGDSHRLGPSREYLLGWDTRSLDATNNCDFRWY